MAFLSAGHLPGEGPFGSTLDRGIRYVLNSQREDGLWGETGVYEMYQHGICTLMVAEVAGLTDAKKNQEIRQKLSKAVALILKAQRTEKDVYRGGWRYYMNSPDADMSITGWQILALKAAKNIGCDVPSQRIDMALDFVMRCWEPAKEGGGFSYMPGNQGGVTVGCTGTGVLAMRICAPGNKHTNEILQAGAYLLKNRIPVDDAYFFYAHYYAAQAAFQLGGNYWNSYRPIFHKSLFSGQNANGSWISNDGLGPSFGTAMAILALAVEFRFLPIYQRGEESKEKNKSHQ
jgi:hypothetical protein